MKNFILLAMLFVAPVLQLVLSILRYRRKIKLPVTASLLLMLALGYLLSYWSECLGEPAVPTVASDGRTHPVLPVLMIIGVFITAIGVSAIALITGIAQFFRWQAKRDREKAEALALKIAYKL